MEPSRIAAALGDVGHAWLAAGVLLHLAGQVARGVGWHAILRLTFPGAQPLSRRQVVACHVAGAGAGGLLSARGGDLVRVVLVRRRVPQASLPALAGTLVVDATFETAVGVGLGIWAASAGLSAAGVGSLATIAPSLLAAVAVLALVSRSGRFPRLTLGARELVRGMAAYRAPRTLLARAVPWQALGRAARLASIACFLLAFGLPAGFAAIACVATMHSGGRFIPVPGVGAAAGAGLLVASFGAVTGDTAHPEAVAALAVAMPGVLTTIGAVLTVVLVLRLSGLRSPRRAIAGLRREVAVAAEAARPAVRVRPL